MNGWIKQFADGTQEIGTDQAVAERLASWLLGRQDNMVGAMVTNGSHMAVLEGPGEYHQSDDFETVIFGVEAPTLIKRRVQRKLVPSDSVIFVERDTEKKVFRCRVMPPGVRPASKFTFVVPLTQEQIGQWLTLELDEKSGHVSMKVLQEKI